ncbi:MAG: [FeFe] hydrogenase H-cluster maturation GTPase HydF [bacterium]|nr:[FeFe] hydrogenase H-cluster maturation GTPase HydF [bacterium]MCP4800129.1 [FeFe] hydrogenase H-cluster maturation GTPase HydF [bacterium]
MKKQSATRGFRLHIGIYGRRNVGKSSLINALTRQDVAIISDTPGTTTDPVSKPMELQPIGPVVLIDTAGIDDTGDLGTLRMKRTWNMLDRCEMVLLVAEAGVWSDQEIALLSDFKKRNLPVVVVFNQADKRLPSRDLIESMEKENIAYVTTSVVDKSGIDELRNAIIKIAMDRKVEQPPLLKDLVSPGQTAVLVIPIDKEAPVGRIILPQVNAIRELLDGDACCVVVKENQLQSALDNMVNKPALVVTDSQAFSEVGKIVPGDIPMTGFSILMARHRGQFGVQVAGAKEIANLRDGDKVLIAESCTHHPVQDDIGRVKIPAWINNYVGGKIDFEVVQGHDFPADLSQYKLVIHCGGCTMNRQEIQSRLGHSTRAGVSVTNYGLAIAFCLGIFDRALAPFEKSEVIA